MADPMIRVTFDEAKLAAVQRLVRRIPGGLGRVCSRGINRTASSGRVRIAREISAGTKLGVRKVSARIYIRRATRIKWSALLGLSDRPYDLARDFKSRFVRGHGVHASVLRDRDQLLPRAFIPEADREERRQKHEAGQTAGIPKGKTFRFWWGFNSVLMRKSQGDDRATWKGDPGGRLVPRFPVVKVPGPSLAELWSDAPGMVARMVAYSQHTLEKNIDDQVKLLLKESFDPGI
jgi:hypothetical protein